MEHPRPEGNNPALTNKTSSQKGTIRICLAGFSIALAAYFIFFLFSSLITLKYPFHLEWMEGVSAIQMERILHGESIYVEPRLEYVPLIYTPLYFYVSAGMTSLFEPHFFALRITSFLSTLGVFALIAAMLWRETKNLRAVIFSVGLFASCYALSGFWYSIARVDMLFLFLILLSIFFLRSKSALMIFTGGFSLYLAFLTKQSVLVFVFAVYLYFLIVSFRKSLPSFLLFMLLTSLTVIAWNVKSGGWFWYYIFKLPGTHSLRPGKIISFWTMDLLTPLFIPIFLSAYFFYDKFKYRLRDGNDFYYPVVFTGLMAISYISRMHSGGWINVLIPAHAAIAILAGMGFSRLEKIFSNKKNIYLYSISLICLLHFVRIIPWYREFDPPGKEDVMAGRNLAKYISNVKGEVFIPSHPWLNDIAGKKTFAHRQAILDIMRSDDEKTRNAFTEEFTRAIQSHRFSVIIMDSPDSISGITRYYRPDQRVFEEGSKMFYPMTGMKTRPEYALVPDKK